MAELSRKFNLNDMAVSHAISRPGYSRRVEKIIADAIGKPLFIVFPNRYTENGEKITRRMVVK